jgi:hypothetical protein
MGWPSPLDDVAPVANERTAVARSERRGGAEALAPGGLEALGRGLRVGEMGDGERELNSIRPGSRGRGIVRLVPIREPRCGGSRKLHGIRGWGHMSVYWSGSGGFADADIIFSCPLTNIRWV